ncbi:hypothetical protein K4888_001768, partial [Campylobacter upsaliensis]|nr:hypothetical protein [Campylobacter upsaliensis]
KLSLKEFEEKIYIFENEELKKPYIEYSNGYFCLSFKMLNEDSSEKDLKIILKKEAK